MTEQDIVLFQKKLEERNFVFNDKLLAQLIAGKMQRLRQQSESLKQMRELKRQ